MAFQPINRGAQPNDNTGDNLREGARKVNANFTEVYNALGTNGTNITFDYKNYKLTEVSDVNVPAPQHEQVLSWDTITSKWISVDKLSGNVVGHMIPTTNNMFDLGDANNNFRDVYVAGNTIFNPGGQRLFSDMGNLKLQYDYQTSNAVLFDSNTSTAASITHTSQSDDVVFTDTTKLDNVTFGGTTIYFFPGIDTSTAPPYNLMPNVVVELTLANTQAGTTSTYSNYDTSVYATPAASHNDAFYFSGRQTLTVKDGNLAASDGHILDDLYGADIATLNIKRISSDGIGEVLIENKTQTIINKTIPAANNTILMSLSHLVDVDVPTANAGDNLTWSNTANAWVAQQPGSHLISGTIVDGHLLPTANAAYDLGSPTSQFKDLYMTGNSIHLGSTVISSSGGKVSFGGATLSAPLEINDHVIPDQNEAYDLGSATNKFRDLYLSSSTINLGAASLSVGPDGLSFREQAPIILHKKSAFINPNLNSQYSRSNSITELQIVQSSTGSSFAEFGWSLAASSNRFVAGNKSGNGGAYLFDLDGNELASLLVTSENLGTTDKFGYAVGVSTNRVAVGAPEQSGLQGAVYIFDIIGNELAKIKASDPLDFDSFGTSVAVSDDRIVVGAPYRQINGENVGVAYIFDINGNEIAKLESDITNQGLYFGRNVAVSDNYVLVAAPNDSDGIGAVYIYTINGVFVNKLTSPDGKVGDSFGTGIAINESLVSPSRILVGAYNEGSVASNAGAVYIYDLQGNLIQKITAYDADQDDRFGMAVAVSDSRIVVGSVYEDKDSANLNSGAVYIYDLQGNPIEKIVASNAGAGDFYGRAVAITDTRIMVGAYREDTTNTNAGSVYLYNLDVNAVPTYQPQLFGIDGMSGFGGVNLWPEKVFANNHIEFSPSNLFTAELTLHEMTGKVLHRFDLLQEGAGDWTDDSVNGIVNVNTQNTGFIIDVFGKPWIKYPTNQLGFETLMQGVAFATFSILDIRNATPIKPVKPVESPAGISASNVPANSSATGTKGDIVVGASYVYICKDTDSWVRVAIDTGW